MFRFNLYWMYGLIFIMLVALYMTNDSSGAKELGWTEFQKLAQENVFDKMTVYNKKNLVEATVKNGKTEQVFGNMDVSKIGVSPKVYVKIPSADKFSDFYDKAVADSHIDTQVRFEEGDPMTAAPVQPHFSSLAFEDVPRPDHADVVVVPLPDGATTEHITM